MYHIKSHNILFICAVYSAYITTTTIIIIIVIIITIIIILIIIIIIIMIGLKEPKAVVLARQQKRDYTLEQIDEVFGAVECRRVIECDCLCDIDSNWLMKHGIHMK